jgi:GcrA cell cycle regulator
MFHLKIKGCRWPFGDPGTDEFHFCGATQEIGKPYCLDHCMIAYRKKEVK